MKSLIGLFVHILDDTGEVSYQGRIHASEDGKVLVQLFSYFDGAPTNIQAYDLADLLRPDKAKLYDCENTWREKAAESSERFHKSLRRIK